MISYETNYIGGTLMTLGVIGASVFPTLIKPTANILGGQLKISTLGSGATVQILPTSSTLVAISGATAIGATLIGYPLGTTEIYQWSGPAAFYLACTVAASTVAIAFNYSAGATLT